MRAKLNKRLEGQGGFTLIELLVVMIIIAILMAVAVPIFLSTKQKATASQAKQNASNLFKTMESCIASNNNGSIADSTGYDCSDTDATSWWFDNEKALQDKMATAGVGVDCYGTNTTTKMKCLDMVVSSTGTSAATAAGEGGSAVVAADAPAGAASYWVIARSAASDAPVTFVINGDTQEKTCHWGTGGNPKKVTALCPTDGGKW